MTGDECVVFDDGEGDHWVVAHRAGRGSTRNIVAEVGEDRGFPGLRAFCFKILNRAEGDKFGRLAAGKTDHGALSHFGAATFDGEIATEGVLKEPKRDVESACEAVATASDFHSETFDSLRINSFAFDVNKTLYIGTNKGLFKILSDSVISLKKAIIVQSLLISSDGILYCATQKGLYKIENNLFQYVKKLNELNIYTIFEDDSKRIWLGTSRGILNFLGNDVKSYSSNDTFLGNSCYSIFAISF